MKGIIMWVLIVCNMQLYAQTYRPVDAGSAVKFSIKNFGLTVNGSFSGLDGKIIFNPAKLTAAFFDVTIQVSSINTGNTGRDKHLRKEDYFDVAKYPAMRFVSSHITPSGKATQFLMEGVLTIKGVSKVVTFPFSVVAVERDYSFDGIFKINRRDFNVGGNSLVLSDVLNIELKISAQQ